MTQFRPQRGTLAESLDDAVKVTGMSDLISHLFRYGYNGTGLPKADQRSVAVEKYGAGIDERCGWDTHIVCINGQGVGYTDGMPES